MTDTVKDAAGRNMAPANPRPCAACPWRTANQGKRHPHGFYTLKNLRRLWGGLRRGERMTCHPTDPEMQEFAGYEGTAERHVTHECAGAQILIQRELDRAQDCLREADAEGKRDGLQRYRRRHPKGLTRDGVGEHFAAMIFGGTLLGGMRPRRGNLNDTGVGHPDLEPWEAK